MKKSGQSRRVIPDCGREVVPPPEKVGWIRKFCGRGIFRELWKNRYVVLRGEHLYMSEKEVKDERKAQEVLDLADYERCEELRKLKSRSKKNHSRFTVLRHRRPGNTVPNLVFLAVSPEEKESWVNAFNLAIIKAKNRVFDQVTIEEDNALAHPTRDRAKIPHGRRLPTRGHLLAVASTSSHGMLTLDLVAEEDYDPEHSFCVDLQGGGACGRVGPVDCRVVGGRQRAGTDVSKLRNTYREPRVKTGSLPRGSERSWGKQSPLETPMTPKTTKNQQVQVLQAQSRTPQPGKRLSLQGRSRCASMDEVLSSRPAMIRSELRSALRRCPTEEEAVGGAAGQPVGQLQSLIAQRMQRAQELLEEMRLQELHKDKTHRERGGSSPYLKSIDSPRLQHLRGGGDSPQSSRSSGSSRSRSSDSPRVKGKDSPRLKGRESPRSKAKKNRSKATESPRSKGSHSPAAKTNHSPRLKDSLGVATDSSSNPNSSLTSNTSNITSSSKWNGTTDEANQGELAAESPPNSPVTKGSDSPRGSESNSPHLLSTDSPKSSTLLLPTSPQKPCESPTPLVSDEGMDVDVDVDEDEEVLCHRVEAERLLEEAVSSWKEAQEVLQEVKELQSQTLRRQRRRTYEKMTSPAVTIAAVTMATEGDSAPAAPTSPEEDEELDTP